MSVYDELMNESPFSRPTGGRSRPFSRPTAGGSRPSTQLSMNPAEEAEFRSRGENPSQSSKQRVQQSVRARGTTPQSRQDAVLMFTKTSGTRRAGQLQQRVYRGASDNSLQQAAGTTYEGPSLREKVEYIARFLEEGRKRDILMTAAITALGITGIGANAISKENARRAEAEKQTPPAITAPATPGEASKKPNTDDFVRKINQDHRQSRKIARETEKAREKNK